MKLHQRMPMHPGDKFGMLTLKTEGPYDDDRKRWWCICDCGIKKLVYQDAIRNHIRKKFRISCGHLRKEIGKKSFKHGHCGKYKDSRTYITWSAMRTRCYNKNQLCYKYYGGRGIKVCERWKNDFNAFIADMGERPIGKTLDRIDGNGDYAPGNCRWATNKEQNQNHRKHVHALTSAFSASGTGF